MTTVYILGINLIGENYPQKFHPLDKILLSPYSETAKAEVQIMTVDPRLPQTKGIFLVSV